MGAQGLLGASIPERDPINIAQVHVVERRVYAFDHRLFHTKTSGRE